MKKWITAKNIFSLFLLLWFAYGIWEAKNYAFLARVFPLYISLILLICAVISIVLEIRKTVDQAMDLESRTGGSDLSVDWDMPMSRVWRRFGFYVGLIGLTYILIYLVGYPLSMMLFIVLFYRFVAKTTWSISLIAGAAGLGFLALTSRLLGMDWPKGLIQLPWPLG